jgi:hypothetical protein
MNAYIVNVAHRRQWHESERQNAGPDPEIDLKATVPTGFDY